LLDTPPNVEVFAFDVDEVFKIVDQYYPLALDIALGIVLKNDGHFR